MKLALPFLLFAASFAALAVLHRGWWLLFLYPAVSFGVISAAYFGVGPRVFGKRADGRRPVWVTLLLGPFLLFTHAIWHTDRIFFKRRFADEVAPGVWVGRRPVPGDDFPADVTTVIDCTAEFTPHRRGFGEGVRYVCLPTLDASACEDRRFRELVDSLASAEGGLFIHCAQGRGRSAALAAAILIRRGLAKDASDAETILQRARPEVRMTAAQRRLVDRVASGNGGPSPGR